MANQAAHEVNTACDWSDFPSEQIKKARYEIGLFCFLWLHVCNDDQEQPLVSPQFKHL